jgi:Tfp pilus assembly protein PilF
VLAEETRLDPQTRERLASLGYLRPGNASSTQPGHKDPKQMQGVRQRLDEAGNASARGEHALAIAKIAAVLEEDPGSGKAWYAAARIYDRAGKPQEAERSLGRALVLSPRSDGWVTLARYALARGDLETFDAALDQAEQLDPSDGGIYVGRGFGLAQQGQLAEALQQFRRAVEIDPVRSGPQAREQISRIEELLADP